MMYEINKFPVMILSSPRTGSTLLANVLSNRYTNLALFSEPDANNTMDRFNEYAATSDQYILKFHLKHLFKFPKDVIKKVINHDAFLIRIRRKNIVDQIVSNYIELNRNVWHYKIADIEKYKEELIEINDSTINLAINSILNFNKKLDELDIKYDLDIYYEDLIQQLDNNDTIVTPKPKNYNELYLAVEETYKNSK